MKKILFILLVLGGTAQAQLHYTGPGSGITDPAALPPGGSPAFGYPAITGITTGNNPVTTAQWHFTGQQTTAYNSTYGTAAGLPSTDWIYGLVTTAKKETIACGFGNNSAGAHSGTIFKLDHNGNMVWNNAVLSGSEALTNFNGPTYTLPTPGGRNDLWAVAKANDGYVAVGRGDHGILVVEVDENGNFINGTPIDVVPPATPTYPSSLTIDGIYAHGFTVAVDPNTNSVDNIIIGGGVYGTGYSGGAIIQLNYSGTGWSVGGSYYGENGASNGSGVSGSQIMKILVKSTGASSYNIYGCGGVSVGGNTTASLNDNYVNTSATNASGDPVSLTTFNKDIWILKTNNAFSSVTSSTYNKNNIAIGGYDLNTINTTTYPYQEFGPLTARNHDNGGGGLGSVITGAVGWLNGSVNALYTSAATIPLNSSNNLNEAAYDMTFTADGNIAVISLVNIIGLNFKTDNSYTVGTVVETGGGGGAAPQFGEYTDGDAFLLKINPSDLSLSGAKNVGHFSGTDFFMQVRQNLEGDYIVAGSTSDRYGTVTTGYSGSTITYTYTPSTNYNLPDPDQTDGLDNAFIVSTDDNYPGSGDLWRRSYLALDTRASADVSPTGGSTPMQDNMMCVFALDLTADGGYEIGGNSSINDDDYTLTKFAPPHQELMVGGTGGSYTKFGGLTVPVSYTVSGSETWPSSNVPTGSNIASWVIVPSGATLTISSGTYHFAASDQLWDYWMAPNNYGGGAYGCGILVQPGGTLNVDDATLTGISTTAEHNVWDGIVVQGVYAGLPSNTVQGNVNLSGATVQDARVGVYVADNYRAYYPGAIANTSNTTASATAFTNSSHYDGTYNLGGGIVSANNDGTVPTTFLDCYYGINFQNYFFYSNTSKITLCNFTSDATGMGDICFYTDANGALVPSNTFITSWQWYGGQIRKNTFACDLSFPALERTNGIVLQGTAVISNSGTGTDAGNSFSNLNCAILAATSCGSNGTTITYNNFDNNNYCINASGLANTLTVKYNNLNIPGNGVTFNPTGITLAGCSGYDVSQNTFDKCSTCSSAISWVNNYGIVINDGAGENEKVNLNTFNHIWFATTPVGTNGNSTYGLQLLCNDYAQSIYDIMRCSYLAGAPYPAPNTMNPQQGNCSGGATTPANNQFYSCTSGTYFPPAIFAADDEVMQNVTYNYFATAPYDPGTPGTCVEANNTLATGDPEILDKNACTGTPPSSVNVACPAPPFQYYSPEPGGNGGLVSALQEISALDAAMAQNTDQSVAVVLQTQHDMDVSFVARYYSQIDSMDSAAAIMAYYNRYRDAFPFYMAASDFRDAASMYNNLPLVTDDDKLYAWEAGLMLQLYSNGQTWFDLDSTSRDSLVNIVQYNSAAGYMAGSIAALLGLAPVNWPVPVVPAALVDSAIGDSSGYGSRTTPGTTVTKGGAQSFSVYPNPTYGSLMINTTMSGRFTLYTMLGQQLADYTVTSGSSDMQLPSGLAPGIYVGEFVPDAGGVTQEVRLVYQP